MNLPDSLLSLDDFFDICDLVDTNSSVLVVDLIDDLFSLFSISFDVLDSLAFDLMSSKELPIDTLFSDLSSFGESASLLLFDGTSDDIVDCTSELIEFASAFILEALICEELVEICLFMSFLLDNEDELLCCGSKSMEGGFSVFGFLGFS